MHQWTVQLCEYECEYEEEITTMVIDDDQDSVDETTVEKMEDVSGQLVSYGISYKEYN